MKIKRQTLFIIGAVLLLIGIAAWMLVIGRGHIIYIDNKTIEYNGTEYKAYNLVGLTEKKNPYQEAFARDRVQLKVMGQNLVVEYEASKKSSSIPEEGVLKTKIPYSWDAAVINLPAYFAGLPEDVWLTEFIQAPATDLSTSEEIVLDEFSTSGF